MSSSCCMLLRGRVHFIPPMNSSTIGWGEAFDFPAGGENAKPYQPGPGRFIGNASGLDITPQIQTFSTPDMTDKGGSSCGASILESLSTSMTLNCFSVDNLKAILFADACITSDEPEQIVGEVLDICGACLDCDDMIFFGCAMVDATAPISITIREANRNYSLREGVDFMRTAMGVRMLKPLNVPAECCEVRATYTTCGGVVHLNGYTQQAIEVGVLYEGVNKVDGSVVILHIFRMRLTPGESFQFINESLNSVTVNAELLPVCPANPADPRYFRMLMKDQNTCGVC